MRRDKWRCRLCGDQVTPLQVHHKEYINGNDPWEYPNEKLITLCEHCHAEISQDDFKDIPYDKIVVYKSDNWEGGSRIMFITNMISGICSMRIYNKDDKFICGYSLCEDIPEIIKILKKAL